MLLPAVAFCRRSCSLRFIIWLFGAIFGGITLFGTPFTSLSLLPSEGVVTVHLLVEGWLETTNEELRVLNAEDAALAWWQATGDGVCCRGQRLPPGDSAAALAYGQKLGEMRSEWRRKHCARVDVWIATLSQFLRPRQRRQMHILCRGPYFTPKEAAEYANLSNQLQQVYTSASMCYNGRCYVGDEQLERAMQNTRQPEFLEWAWLSWRDTVGRPSRSIFRKLVILMNTAAKRRHYMDMGECWREELDTRLLEEEVFRLYEQVEPLYIMLHAVVRHHLANYYGDDIVDRKEPIPAHLLGNMWAQNWAALTDVVMPSASQFDIGRMLRQHGVTVMSMVRSAEDMYVSMGLPKMPESFWKRSRFERTALRNVNCHGTAANMFQDHDYRMLYCAEVSREDYEVIHHEMGHIEYYMAYENQPTIFREGATSALQEAVGDAVSLAASVPQHLQRLSVTNDSASTDEMSFSVLLQQALSRIPQLPFALVVDKWRWDVFRGVISPETYNHDWWHLRKKYLGITPPVPRSEADFDPGAKYHIANNVPYIRYFLSGILQVQLFKGMCQHAIYGAVTDKPLPFPLHQCDIYGSKRSGAALWRMLKLGRSRPWPEALKILTGSKHYDVQPLLEYYAPLTAWLKQQIEKYNITVGWEHEEPAAT
ncbi:angiotensin-converting enzyme-like [Schistocerca gregaria]|uniref:angiotensin-converting enzyme-like n=1 Tax=Schistocerca gregaria TaxID=7010 RepID=UPI00211EBB0C|nr:angiotensin-converting enzyme-like [Schistocerca gregaria]